MNGLDPLVCCSSTLNNTERTILNSIVTTTVSYAPMETREVALIENTLLTLPNIR